MGYTLNGNTQGNYRFGEAVLACRRRFPQLWGGYNLVTETLAKPEVRADISQISSRYRCDEEEVRTQLKCYPVNSGDVRRSPVSLDQLLLAADEYMSGEGAGPAEAAVYAAAQG